MRAVNTESLTARPPGRKASATSTTAPHQKVLAELLLQIEPIDFRERAGLDEDAKITRKLSVVIAIEEVLDVATANNWGLCTKNGFI